MRVPPLIIDTNKAIGKILDEVLLKYFFKCKVKYIFGTIIQPTWTNESANQLTNFISNFYIQIKTY